MGIVPRILIFILFTLSLTDHAFSRKRKIRRKDPKIIVGGKDAEIEDHPYQVLVVHPYSKFCGGSIISEWYILTAAHCTEYEILRIRTGSSFLNDGGETYLTKNFTRHNTSDVAILRLERAIVFDKTRQPIQLFNDHEEVAVGSIGEVAGWGLTNEYGKKSEKLQVAYVPVVDAKVCNSTYQDMTENEFCAGFFDEGQIDACEGDSGGPLVINKRQAGVVKAGEGCARPDYPGIYEKVGPVRQWIREVTGV